MSEQPLTPFEIKHLKSALDAWVVAVWILGSGRPATAYLPAELWDRVCAYYKDVDPVQRPSGHRALLLNSIQLLKEPA